MALESSELSPTEIPTGLGDQPSIGFATTLGTLATFLGLVGAVWAAIQGNDVATAGAAAGSILALITTLGGRYAQATSRIAHGLDKASPWIDEIQKQAALHARSPQTPSSGPTGSGATPIDPTLPPS